MQSSGSKYHNQALLIAGIRATAPVFVTAIVFSFFINLLLFTSPLYMLQIYDRVITSRNETTLLLLTLIAAFCIVVYAILEMLRSRVLVRAGMLFDEKISCTVFNAVHRGNLRQPGGNHVQCLRDVDTIREFLTGSGLITLCDAPWFPIFVAASFLLHPWFGYLALAGSLITLLLTVLNELVTRKRLASAGWATMAANQNAQATFRNTEAIHAMGMLSALRQIWSKHHGAALHSQASASDRAGIIIASTKFFRMFLQTAVLGTGGYLVIYREISPGAMIAASILISRALQPIELAVGNWKGFLATRSAFERVRMLFTVAGAEPERMSLPPPLGALKVSDLIASAPGKNAALQFSKASHSIWRRAKLSGSSDQVPPASRAWRASSSVSGPSCAARCGWMVPTCRIGTPNNSDDMWVTCRRMWNSSRDRWRKTSLVFRRLTRTR
jgi:ATP-binding cassette subfamily C protein